MIHPNKPPSRLSRNPTSRELLHYLGHVRGHDEHTIIASRARVWRGEAARFAAVGDTLAFAPELGFSSTDGVQDAELMDTIVLHPSLFDCLVALLPTAASAEIPPGGSQPVSAADEAAEPSPAEAPAALDRNGASVRQGPITTWVEASDVLGTSVWTLQRRRRICKDTKKPYFRDEDELREWWNRLNEPQPEARTRRKPRTKLQPKGEAVDWDSLDL